MANTYLSRIIQIDATKLDSEIVDVFRKQINNITNFMSPGFLTKFEPEINLLLRILIFKNSLYKNHATFGQQLLGIKYENFTKSKLYIYAFLKYGVIYLKTKYHLLNSTDFSNDLEKIITIGEGILSLASFLNFLVFLNQGKYPFVIDRLLNIHQVSTISKRYMNSSYIYTYREILWHSFIELLMVLLPLLNYHSFMRRIRSMNPWYKKSINEENKKVFTQNTKCPHCNQKPTLPHHMGCSHIFCFYCLQANLEADMEFECPKCRFTGKKCIKFIM